jgi:peroxiredoxin
MHHKINDLSYCREAPELDVTEWLNTDTPISLASLKGKVIVLHSFQMLCPSCVTHSIPQAMQLHQFYQGEDVQVIGMHTVFEHNHVMTTDALKVFVDEYRIPFPIATDKPALPEDGRRPTTMRKYHMEGTPTLVIIDKQGRIRLNHLGRLGNLEVGNFIGGLLSEESNKQEKDTTSHTQKQTEINTPQYCNDGICLAKKHD